MNLNAANFDLINARECVDAALLAYTQPATIANPAMDTQLIVLERSDCVIIAFRGSTTIRDWIIDAHFLRALLLEEADGSRCEVHAGFLDAFESIVAPLMQHLRDIVVAGRKIFVAGHSLGGALAILAALELKRQGFAIAQVYTFGQPRVGNGAFARMYDFALGASTFRVVYQEDIVARIPHLPKATDPYRHVGTEILLGSFGGLTIAPSLWRLLLSDAWGIYRAFSIGKFSGALDPIHDHQIINYTSGLDAINL